ncbi:hypothetical protein E2C01_091530 [Portunus trituberculatus]|uniref:Uncharacterized protein n=1 Tax=Portunus trituberculatus TaxID=210409 RepID=A0A5B7JHR5_PORTR|nr:hypothetical protein [Portunus trituberculatus]
MNEAMNERPAPAPPLSPATRQVFASVAAAPHLPAMPLSIPAAPIKQVKNAMKTLQALTTALKNTNLYSEEATHPRDAHQQVLTDQHCLRRPASALCGTPPSRATSAAAVPPPLPQPPRDGGSDVAGAALKDFGLSSRKVVPTKFVAAIVILLSVNERNAICRQRQEINRPSRAHAVGRRGAAPPDPAPCRTPHRAHGRGLGERGLRPAGKGNK